MNNKWARQLVLAWVAWLGNTEPVPAQAKTNPTAPAPTAPVRGAVAATVAGAPIWAAEVAHELRQVLRQRAPDAPGRAQLEAQVLKLLVDRQLVLQRFAREQRLASLGDVDLAIQRMQAVPAQQEISWADYLQQLEIDEPALRRRLTWQLSWARYLGTYLTDENLKRYFEKHRRHFDGSRIRVAHLLLAVPAPGDAAQRTATIQQAGRIRDEMVAGGLSFAAAARKYSVAPTADEGGALGWIARHEPMPESFSRVAFALAPGEISPPVRTAFGVHLIECQEVQPGEITWVKARDELETEIAKYLFSWCADQERSRTTIELKEMTPEVRAAWNELTGNR